MFADESRGTKDCNSQIGVGLATARTTLVESSLGDSRHEQIGFVVSGRSSGAIGRCEGPTRAGGDRPSLGETSGSGGSSQHDNCAVADRIDLL